MHENTCVCVCEAQEELVSLSIQLGWTQGLTGGFKCVYISLPDQSNNYFHFLDFLSSFML